VASSFPGRHSVSAREAAAEAIARGKPRLARYMARRAISFSVARRCKARLRLLRRVVVDSGADPSFYVFSPLP
jgi:hypothetical protein